MWYATSGDETMIMSTPILVPGDVCGVIDTLDENGKVYAALVVSSQGIGCILTDAEYFEPL